MKAKFLLQPHFYQNKRIQLKQVLREKFIALSVHARTEERFTISDLSFHLKKLEKGVLFLHNGLKIRHCHCRGLGHCCDMGLIPGLGKFPIPCVWPKKKKKRSKKKKSKFAQRLQKEGNYNNNREFPGGLVLKDLVPLPLWPGFNTWSEN